jgi:hypothetical protein
MAPDEGYPSPIDADERAALIDDPEEGVLGKVFGLLAEALSFVAPAAQAALLDSDVLDAQRLPATSDAAIAAMYPQIIKLLGGPPTLLHAAVTERPSTTGIIRRIADHEGVASNAARVSADGVATDVARGANADDDRVPTDVVPRVPAPGLLEYPPTLLFSSPPLVVFGPRLASVRAKELAPTEGTELRFLIGRVVELSRPSRIFAGGQDTDAFALLVAALHHAFGGGGASAARDLVATADRLRAKVPVALRGRLAEWLGGLAAAQLDAGAYHAACHRAADRAGLLACNDIAVAVAAAPHLVKLAASRRYLTLRRRLRR